MPKIIGVDDSLKKQCTCKRCASIVEYWPDEVEHHNLSNMGDSAGTFYFIPCPKEGCRQNIKVERPA